MKDREYYITDGYKFAKQNQGSNKYVFTSNYSLADVWDSPKVADAIINNSIPMPLRNKCYVAYFEKKVLIPYSMSKDEKQERRERIMQGGNSEKAYALAQYSFDNDEDIIVLIEGFEKARVTLEHIQKQYKQLEERLIYLDYADEDIKHYLGVKRINAREGYKLSSLRQQIVLERISVKNQIEIVKSIRDQYVKIYEPISAICKCIDELRNQKYKPRVFKDLFENGVNKVEIRRGIHEC